MDAREYLEQVHKDDVRLDGLRFEVKRLENMSLNLSSKPTDQDKVMTSGSQDRVANITVKLMEKKAVYERMIDEKEHRRDAIISQIYSLDDTTSSQILFSLFIENKSYQDVANELNYSYDHLRRLSKSALKKFEKTCEI